jgi:hypothetical protein
LKDKDEENTQLQRKVKMMRTENEFLKNQQSILNRIFVQGEDLVEIKDPTEGLAK